MTEFLPNNQHARETGFQRRESQCFTTPKNLEEEKNAENSNSCVVENWH